MFVSKKPQKSCSSERKILCSRRMCHCCKSPTASHIDKHAIKSVMLLFCSQLKFCSTVKCWRELIFFMIFPIGQTHSKIREDIVLLVLVTRLFRGLHCWLTVRRFWVWLLYVEFEWFTCVPIFFNHTFLDPKICMFRSMGDYKSHYVIMCPNHCWDSEKTKGLLVPHSGKFTCLNRKGT